jgi:hypothetical protein
MLFIFVFSVGAVVGVAAMYGLLRMAATVAD